MMRMIMITLKGAIGDFYNLTAPRTVSSTYVQMARAQLCVNHEQHVQDDVCHVVRRDSSVIEFDRLEIAFILAVFLLAEAIYRRRRG